MLGSQHPSLGSTANTLGCRGQILKTFPHPCNLAIAKREWLQRVMVLVSFLERGTPQMFLCRGRGICRCQMSMQHLHGHLQMPNASANAKCPLQMPNVHAKAPFPSQVDKEGRYERITCLENHKKKAKPHPRRPLGNDCFC